MDRFTALCYASNIGVRKGKFVCDLLAVGGSYQLE
jgi:hypothetical protein